MDHCHWLIAVISTSEKRWSCEAELKFIFLDIKEDFKKSLQMIDIYGILQYSIKKLIVHFDFNFKTKHDLSLYDI